MESKVSRRLTEKVAEEVCEHIYAPRLARDFRTVFGYMSDLNQAHVLMLARCGLSSPQAAKALAVGLLRELIETPAAAPGAAPATPPMRVCSAPQLVVRGSTAVAHA